MRTKIVVAPDSFKGSLTAVQAARAMARGVLRALPGTEVVESPLSDGGEGFVEVLGRIRGSRSEEVEVSGPLGEPVLARILDLPDGRGRVIESAQTCGMTLVPPDRRDPLRATSRGLGELIGSALDAGCTDLVVGLGGSATVDGGVGMARALGARFLDHDGAEILGPGPMGLDRLARVDTSGLDGRLESCRVTAAVDVDNPLVGPGGGVRVFAPQKGADARKVELLETGLRCLARAVEPPSGEALVDLSGAGAAGGLGFGLAAFCGAELRSGIDLVLDWIGFGDALMGADLILTGEGRADAQSGHGKVVAGVARWALECGLGVAVVAGSLGPGAESLRGLGVGWILSVADSGAPRPDGGWTPDSAGQSLASRVEGFLRTEWMT